jgi:TctA family transporter
MKIEIIGIINSVLLNIVFIQILLEQYDRARIAACVFVAVSGYWLRVYLNSKEALDE